MISNYRRMLMQAIDFGCILLALIVCEFCTLPPELNVFKDYTGACIFTFFFYLLFFYILDAYSVGTEDFKETIGRVLRAGHYQLGHSILHVPALAL